MAYIWVSSMFLFSPEYSEIYCFIDYLINIHKYAMNHDINIYIKTDLGHQ